VVSLAIPRSITGICSAYFAEIAVDSLLAFTKLFAAIRQSFDSQVIFALVIIGFFAHLYFLPFAVVVWFNFVHLTPFEMVAAEAGTAVITPATTKSATLIETSLRM
jgi:hypothetical protein